MLVGEVGEVADGAGVHERDALGRGHVIERVQVFRHRGARAVLPEEDRDVAQAQLDERVVHLFLQGVALLVEVPHRQDDAGTAQYAQLVQRAEHRQAEQHVSPIVPPGLADQDELFLLLVIQGEARGIPLYHVAGKCGRVRHIVVLLRPPDHQVCGASDSGHEHRVEEPRTQRGKRRQRCEGVVLHEALHEVPDGVRGTALAVAAAAERLQEPLAVAAVRQAAPLGRPARRGGAHPEGLYAGPLRVAQPAADRRSQGGKLVVARAGQLRGIRGPARHHDEPDTQLLASSVEELRSVHVKHVVVRRVWHEHIATLALPVLLPLLHAAHDDHLARLLGEELLVVAQEERAVLERRDHHQGQRPRFCAAVHAVQ
mmetsp:Transcript_62673/g.161276  ORF Transcript_62673/g.161276 Transcript_62673/m.161276 type:complete len:371 (-) Transcript_62673:473-1585(-)